VEKYRRGVIMLVKKNIVIDNEIWAKLKILSKINNELSISEIIRQAVDKFLEKKKKDIDFQIKLRCDYIDDEEQRDIEESLAKLSKEDLAVVRKRRL
jgi:predicted CopG family antitoxin